MNEILISLWRKNMKLDFNIMDFFKLPTKIIASIAIATGLILFIPDSITNIIYMTKFRVQYGFAIGIIFTISFSILMVEVITSTYQYLHQKHLYKKFLATANERLKKLDYFQKAIIYLLYSEHNHTHELPINDGAVRSLEYSHMIVKTTSQYLTDMDNPLFPYMLQPWVIGELQTNRELLKSFEMAANMEID